MNQTASDLVYEGLFTLDESFGFTPLLCEDWWTTDGTYFTFTIKDGVSFHDGSPLTAYDAVYSLNQARHTAAYGSRFTTMSGISAADAKTFSISLSKANMLFPALLDVPVIKEGTVGETNPAGTGPYTLAHREDYYYLTAFKGWAATISFPKGNLPPQYDTTASRRVRGSYLDLVCTDPTDVSSVNLAETAIYIIRHYLFQSSALT